jgi:hypothetical protein
MASGCVGVSMFFNLKPLGDSNEAVRPSEFYEKNCRATLSIKSPLVLFCDSVTRKWIQPLRSKLSDAPTYYIEKPLQEYDFYALNHPIIVANRKDKSLYQDPSNRNTPSYFLTCMFKVVALKLASEIVPDASHYAWIDFGCQHVVWEAESRLETVLNSPRPKVAMTYIHYRSNNFINNVERCLWSQGVCSLAGTVYTVEKAYVNVFYSRCLSVFYEQLSLTVGHNDEQVYMYVYDRFPELFTLVYGDYYSVVSNYHGPVRDYHTIKHCFINTAIAAGRRDLASDCAIALIKSYETGKLILYKDDLDYISSLVV